MKNFLLAALLTAGIAACNQSVTYTYTIEDVSSQYSNLPGLHSFAFGKDSLNDAQYWLMFGGRTNGFHGFGGQENFPVTKSNSFIHVYNATKNVLHSFHVDSLPGILKNNLKWQFMSTNMQCRQVDSFLYVCGGYGGVVTGTNDTSWVTQNLFTRIHIKDMVKAIIAKDTTAMKSAIAYDTSSFVAATGGELYKMSDGKFYLVVGHNMNGTYSADSTGGKTIQKYLDAVHVFSLTETSSSIKLDLGSFKKITDGLDDGITQFRRRDLNVVPALETDGKYGITIYSGVFDTAGNPFKNPIYISPSTSSYTVDKSFNQVSNVYSAPNFTMYDATGNRMLTTVFGGLGDTLAVNDDNAAFTKFITTLERSYKANSSNTKENYNPTGLPDYVGSEGTFIHASGLPLYKNNNLGIVDFNQLPLSQPTTVGLIYGGIYSDSTQWNNDPKKSKINITSPSNKVYKVSITKTPASN